MEEKKINARIRLDLTINPLGCSDSVKNLFNKISLKDLIEYPNPPELPELKEGIAKFTNLKEENVLLTAGSDQAIEIVLNHLLELNSKVGIQECTFFRFKEVAKALCNAEIEFFNNLGNLPDSKVIILCTPNNPTTDEIPKEELVIVIKKNQDKLFIIDAVFNEFTDWEIAELIQSFDNVIILRTFSKAFGLAGIRLGFILANKEVINLLKVGISPFRVPTIIQKIGLEALKDIEHIEKTKIFLNEQWGFIKRNLGDSAIRNSNAPFFILNDKNAESIHQRLLEKGISVVLIKNNKNFLRIMIGKERENRILIKLLKHILKIDYG